MSNNEEDPTQSEAAVDAENMDSDEEDEDYVPGADGEDGDDGSDNDEANDPSAAAALDDTARGPVLSITKQKAVDDAFDDLFGMPATSTGIKSPSKIPSKKTSHTKNKQRNILSSIFGTRSTNKLITTSKNAASLAKPKPSSNGILRLEKRTVVEVKRFAGQEIKVEKIVMVPVMVEKKSSDEKMEATGVFDATIPAKVPGVAKTQQHKVQPQGLDSLLDQMSRPEKLSTVAKTSADWDLFKEKSDNQLKEDLEKKALGKEAFLVKKDFLNRVDARKFELEKAERERERVKRAASERR